MRALLYVLGAVLVISMLRSIIGVIGKMFSELSNPASATNTGSGSGRTTASSGPEVLQRDPVCGTFIAPSAAVHKSIGGKTYHFCSETCRDKFKATA